MSFRSKKTTMTAMKSKKIAIVSMLALLLSGLIAPQSADANLNRVGIKCFGKDKVAGVCLSKSRKKYPISVENNYLLSCVANAREVWADSRSQAGLYCGCTIEQVEKRLSLAAFGRAEKYYIETGQFTQPLINAMAACADYMQQ